MYTLIHMFGSYVSFKMIKVFNKSDVKNKKIEIISFIIFYFINLFMTIKMDIPSLNLIISGLAFFALSFNYKSTIQVKFSACAYTLALLFLAEIIVGLVVGETFETTTEISKETLHIFLSCKIIEFVTITFIDNRNSKKSFFNIKYFYWYISLEILMCVVYADIIIQSGTLPFRQAILSIAILIYMLLVFIFLCIKQQKESQFIMQERDNYVRRYELLETASHTLVEVQNNINNHVTVLKELAEGNEKILSYLNDISHDIVLVDECIDTGNQITDSIINTKISEAKSKGITVKYEILIPMNLKEDYTITIILGTLFDAAIEELETAKNKNLYFFMKYDRGHILIWFIHSDEVSTEIRQKNKYIYRDTFKMRSVKKAVEKYKGSLQIEVNNKRVEAFVQICM